jgi:hypothetical protein
MSHDPRSADGDEERTRLQRVHLRVGWTALLAFALLGVALELLHAWKVPSYLAVGAEPRRLLWTLAHAHGLGLALINLALAATARLLPGRLHGAASPCLLASTLLIPGGFFAGGCFVHGGDPGLGVLLVPPGALLLLLALALVVRAALARASR